MEAEKVVNISLTPAHLRAYDVTFENVTSVRHVGRHSFTVRMVNTCCVFCCTNCHEREKGSSYFKIPNVIAHQGRGPAKYLGVRRLAKLAKIN